MAVVLLPCICVFLFFAYRTTVTWRWGVAECLVWQSEMLTQRFILSEDEARGVHQLIKNLAKKVDSGKVSPGLGMQVVASFYRGPVFMALLHASLENYLRQASLPEDFVAAEMLSASAGFFYAAERDEVAASDFAEIEKNLMSEKMQQTATGIGLPLSEKVLSFREDLDPAELAACREKMKALVKKPGGSITYPVPAAALKKLLTAMSVGE